MNKRQIIATVILGMAVIYITLFVFQTGNKAQDDFNKAELVVFVVPLSGLVIHLLRDGSKDEMLKLKRFWRKH